MKVVGNFLKVSFDQFVKDWEDTFNVSDKDYIADIYESIKLPERSTSGSAGYDFVSPLSFSLEAGEDIKIPTGIRCEIKDGWVLLIFPRSSLGFKYNITLMNTIAVIDSDFVYSDSEGHIFIKIKNSGHKTIMVEQGDRFCQGIFLKYGITGNDTATKKRNGGLGSTGK